MVAGFTGVGRAVVLGRERTSGPALCTTRRASRAAAARVSMAGKGPADADEGAQPAVPGDSEEPAKQHEVPQSDVDWNSEWARFKDSGMKVEGGKGREPDSKQVVAAKKAVGQVQRSINTARNNMPTRRALFADWKFWVGIIVSLSLFTALVNSSSQGVGQI